MGVQAMLDFNSFCLLIQSNFDEIYNHQKCLDDSMSEDKVIEHFKTLNRGTMDQFDQICKNLIFCGISNSGKYLSDKIKPKILINGEDIKELLNNKYGQLVIIGFNFILCYLLWTIVGSFYSKIQKSFQDSERHSDIKDHQPDGQHSIKQKNYK